MLVCTSKTLLRLCLVIGLCVGYFSPAVYAFEGDLSLPAQGESNIVFEMRNDQEGISPSDVFLVFVGSRDECCEGKSPIAGRYSISERVVTFVPAFEFIEGRHYTVMVRNKDGAHKAARSFNEFTVKRTIEKVSPEIVSIFPSGNNIPENTLRFYIHFSTPMRPHVSSDYIKLVDATGTPDTAAFMAFKQELWSEDRKRLTLLMDPGRIKRGVAQNLTLGPALLEGRSYSIKVDEGWPTANDDAVMPGYESNFTVSKALRTLPDPDQWSITWPRQLSNEPLLIEFDRPFDYELLLTGISVLDESGQVIPGAITVERQERTWRFDRNGTWSNSQVQLTIDTQLEDVAGNNLIELLDHVVNTESSSIKQKIITMDLEPSHF